MKNVIFVGSSNKDIEGFSLKAKSRIAVALDAVRAGVSLKPNDFKYMPTVGAGVYELRVKTDKQYRVFYVAKFEEAIYVLHAFVKKTQQTSQKDIELGAVRYKALLNERKARKL